MAQTPFDQLVVALARARSRRQLASSVSLVLVGFLGGSEAVMAGKKHKHHKKSKHPTGHCQDGVQNFGETDVDCGGPCAQKCDFGLFCAVDTDCTTGICELVAENPLGKVCTECRLDSDCDRLGDPRKFRCFGHVCKECALNADCPRPGQPAAHKFCVEPVIGGCPPNQPCVCGECRTSGDCPAGSICDETNTCFGCGSAQGIGVEGCSCVPDGEPCTPGTDRCCSPSSTCVARNGQTICFD